MSKWKERTWEVNPSDSLPDDKRGEKTLKEITNEINSLLKHYKMNSRVAVEMVNGLPKVITLNFEIFL